MHTLGMRIRFTTFLTVFVIVCNILILYYCVRIISINSYSVSNNIYNREPHTKVTNKTSLRHVHKLVTIVLRDFTQYENDIRETIHSFTTAFPNIEFLIVYDELPYPPLDVAFINSTHTSLKFINLSPVLNVPEEERNPIFYIKTKYVLFVPDSARINSKQLVMSMLKESIKRPGNIMVGPIKNHDLGCLDVNISVREWTLKYSLGMGLICDEVTGMQVMLVETNLLRKVADAFLQPFPKSLYTQTSLLEAKAIILKNLVFNEGSKPILKSHHSQWKKQQIDQEREAKFYKLFKIKQVVTEMGTVKWFGCSKNTPRCFGTVLNSMPSYLFEKKWTPPCCLNNLRKTAKHVFNALDEAGVRYWLEAGSLLGAMRNGDILPWDYDVDVGVMRDDLDRCTWLKKSKDKSTIDANGFLWEKATEGNFFRVHFSKQNKIHVNLFPFHQRNGTMVKDSWFTSHKNMEFPESFLHPMSSLEFVGRSVPCPNNIRDFLELKFGKGCIENPQYPDPSKLKFP